VRPPFPRRFPRISPCPNTTRQGHAAMTIRPSRVAGVLAGVAVLAGATGWPALAQPAGSPAAAHTDAERSALVGSRPAWATAAAKVTDVDRHQVRDIRVALALRDASGAHRAAQEITNPRSPRYRQFLTGQQFLDRFGPTNQAVAEVSGWL